MHDISIKVTFWGEFKENFALEKLKLSQGSSLYDLIEALKRKDRKQIIESKGIFALAVNGDLMSDYYYQLQDQDHVDVLPPVTGG